MNTQEAIKEFLARFPEYGCFFKDHTAEYGKPLMHVFFAETVNTPLIELLRKNSDTKLIRAYCSFIEEMWERGDESVKNIADVTILEQLSDDKQVWRRFGTYISDDFIRYINNELLKENIAMRNADRLEYNGRKGRKWTNTQ